MASYEPLLTSALDSLIPGYSVLSRLISHFVGFDVNTVVSIAVVVAAIVTGSGFLWPHLKGIFLFFFSSSISVDSYDPLYDAVVKWFSGTPAVQRVRALHYSAGASSINHSALNELNEDDIFNYKHLTNNAQPQYKPDTTSGFFMYCISGRWYMICVSYTEEKAFGLWTSKVTLTVLGSTTQPLKDLIEKIRNADFDQRATKTIIYRPAPTEKDRPERRWKKTALRPRRPFETVVLSNQQKKTLLRDMNEFLSKEAWYAERGIPYRRGYLFHGPPGTGKTSLSLALAGIFGLDIYCLSLSDKGLTEEDLILLFSNLPERCIVLLEDIDSAGLPTRNAAAETAPDSSISLSGLLNVIDGAASPEGRVLVMTTNYPEKLDDALIRPGRVDLQVRFELTGRKECMELFIRMYDGIGQTGGKTGQGTPGSVVRRISEVLSSSINDEDTDLSLNATPKPTKPTTAKLEAHATDIKYLAKWFALLLPPNVFSPAEIQGYLLIYKNNPVLAVFHASEWQDVEMKRKGAGSPDKDKKDTCQISDTDNNSESTWSESGGAIPSSEPVIRASKPKAKEVHEVWNPETYAYKIIESPPTPDLTELDAYVFVVRKRVERKTFKSIVYIDINSEELQNTLRSVLKDIPWISLSGEKMTVEQPLLYHYLPELMAIQEDTPQETTAFQHLDLLTRTVRRRYESTIERLESLLKEGKITYDLLWAFFKPNSHMISVCHGSRKLRCLRYMMGEEKMTHQRVEYFELQCQYLDFDGNVFGAVTEKLRIEKFREARAINTLSAFPLQFHTDSQEEREKLVQRGRQFISFLGSHHHVHFEGHAFFQKENGIVRTYINSRIVVDPRKFRKHHPSYPRFFIEDSSLDSFLDDTMSQTDLTRLKSIGILPDDLSANDLLLCAPTVLGFSLGDRKWGEFAVDNIRPISWSSLPLDCLAIPTAQKDIIEAVTKRHLKKFHEIEGSGNTLKAFDDIVEGKGRGINILLHGPPGVGKTLTAELFSEHFCCPLYSVSAGELDSNPAELEEQLVNIFDIAHEWNALVLIDEADVFLHSRDPLTIERNRLVAVFLRKLEYFDGVLFLTTNMFNGLDVSFKDRMHLLLEYKKLERSKREVIIDRFLRNVTDNQELLTDKEFLGRFANISLSGRDIKNIISLTTELAKEREEDISSLYIAQALNARGHFLPDSSDATGGGDLYD